MPIDPRLARMILGGAHFGALNEALVVVAALAVQDPRERPADKQMQADQNMPYSVKQIQISCFISSSGIPCIITVKV